MASQTHFLLIDKQETRCQQFESILRFLGYAVHVLDETNPETDKLQSTYQGVFLGEMDNQESLERLLLKQTLHYPFVLIDSEPNKIQDKHLQRAIVGVCHTPLKYDDIMTQVHACQLFWQQYENKVADPKIVNASPFEGMVGVSQSMQTVFRLMQQVARTDVNVLILGESGTGKEVVAQNLHALSDRRDKAFVPVNCGAIPADLLESELFGHEKGAFTGAISTRQGRFELAKGGTIFLDEIGDMPLAMQVKLLRVLQERCYERVGSSKSIQADVRIIAATNCNLEAAIADGKFREDLYYRLNVFPIEIPALRQRTADIPLLVNEILHAVAKAQDVNLHILPQAVKQLVQYGWPGNVRELVNLIERLAILYPNGVVDVAELPSKFQGAQPQSSGHTELDKACLVADEFRHDNIHLPNDGVDLKEHLAKTELALIRQALDESNGIVAKAASYLHMRRTTLVEKMRKYGISRQDCVNTHG